MTRRLAAIVVADVVGYSRLLAADEAGTLAALKERRKAVVEPLVREHLGRIVKFMGDGVLIEFASAVNAVAFALDLQRRMTEMNEPIAEARRIMLRIGINLGEVVGEGSDIFGDGVNVASRLEAVAEAGGIAVSGKVYEEVKGKVDAAFEDVGEVALKNIMAPVRAWRLRPPEAVGRGNAPVASERITIAVLPFTNMSGDASQEYFADGLTEDLITALAKSRHLHVLSRNASFEYKGRVVNIPEVGKQLGARYVLEGSVRTGGNRVRVTAQLIDAATGGHVWAERFDREMADVFAVQDEIVGAIAGRLALGLVDTFAASRRKAPTENLTAYEHLLKGRSAWRLGSFVETRDHYLKAAELDPGYAAALAGLSFLYSYDLYTQLIDERPVERERLARSYAARAIACDDGDDYIQHSIGTSFLCLGELEKAKYHLETAISLNPFFPYSWMNLGNTLSCLGMHKEALELIGKGFRLEPRVAPAMRVDFEVYTALGDCAAARDAFNQINRPFAFQYLLLACCFAQADRAEEAAKAMAGFETERGLSFDTFDFARRWVSLYRRQEDEERLRTGFRKLGIEI
ncbi:MAG: adenylate/guanylate cyclase domain-containing protein [Hyphomicrobiaceae bacterium]